MSIGTSKKEYILCAAIWYKYYNAIIAHKPINTDQGVVICGFNHAACINTFYVLTGHKTSKKTSEQGFLTSKNRFVDRKEASTISIQSGQIEESKHGYGLDSSEIH